MDLRSFAYLDKSRLKVMCGSCGKQIAHVHETIWAPEDNHDDRFKLGSSNRLRRILSEKGPGVYRFLNKELQEVQFEVPVRDSDQSEEQVVFSIGSVSFIVRTVAINWGYMLQPDGVWKLNPRAAKRVREGKLPSIRRQQRVVHFYDGYGTYHAPQPKGKATDELELPAKLQCQWCASVQILDQEPLQLTVGSFVMGSDMEAWVKRYWPDDYYEAIFGSGRRYTLIVDESPC
jgi:ribosomal protein L44E